MKFATGPKSKKEGKQDEDLLLQYFHRESMLVIRFWRSMKTPTFLNTACFLDISMHVV